MERVHPKGTVILVLLFFIIFVTFYVLNWIWLRGIWYMR